MNNKLIVLASLFFFGTSGCSPLYDPKFRIKEDQVQSELFSIAPCDKISIEGVKHKLEDTLILSLTVHLVNVENLTTIKDSLMGIQKRIAKKLKSLLKDPNQYNTYNVWFMYEKGDQFKSEKGPIFHYSFNKTEL